MNPLRIAIIGATGRMGRALLQLAAADPGLQVAAAVTVPEDPLLGQEAGRVAGGVAVHVPLTSEISSPVDAVIEFTNAAGCARWVAWCERHGVPLVSGSTGLNETQQATLHTAARRVPIVWAPNMSVGVNLLLALVAEVAAKLDVQWDIEICEAHHRRKIDAPSGTAAALLKAVCAARHTSPDQVAVYGRAGDCGPRPTGQIGVHAVRMGAIVGEHEVHFTSDAESLTLRHRAFARDTFAAGALRAAVWLRTQPPGLYGMRDVLGL